MHQDFYRIEKNKKILSDGRMIYICNRMNHFMQPNTIKWIYIISRIRKEDPPKKVIA